MVKKLYLMVKFIKHSQKLVNYFKLNNFLDKLILILVKFKFHYITYIRLELIKLGKQSELIEYFELSRLFILEEIKFIKLLVLINIMVRLIAHFLFNIARELKSNMFKLFWDYSLLLDCFSILFSIKLQLRVILITKLFIIIFKLELIFK